MSVAPVSNISEAKRALGRELRSKDGFVGVGIADDRIRLYAKAKSAPVVEFFEMHYGATYQGYSVSVVTSSGFHAGSVT